MQTILFINLFTYSLVLFDCIDIEKQLQQYKVDILNINCSIK